MELESKSASIPLTSQHLVTVSQLGCGWEETYKKLDSLGRGGCAEVFKALDKRSGEVVALKVSNESGEELRRFSREVATLRKLRHQNVIEILDAGDCWYTMPFADGNLTSLAPELCDEERIEAVAQAAKGLAAVHAAGLVHRDVSPNNILRIGERWVVSDFGFVRKPQGMSSTPRTQGVLGTPGYMAPEAMIYGSHQVDPRADMYSLGRTVVFITTGKHPYFGGRLQVPRIWENLVEKMTSMAVHERFQTMEALLAALSEVRRQLKERRRTEWSGRHETVEGLHPQEVKVLTWIIRETNHTFHERELFNRMPREERATFNIGLLGLKRRKFLKDVVDNNGEAWGSCLTDAACDWVLANAALLDAPSLPELEKPQDEDDDIPF